MLCPLDDGCHGVSGAMTTHRDAPLADSDLESAQNLSILGHEKTSLENDSHNVRAFIIQGWLSRPDWWLSSAGLLAL